ncbi:MAG: MltA domain-containing protein [Pseudomonadota bacterium]
MLAMLAATACVKEAPPPTPTPEKPAAVLDLVPDDQWPPLLDDLDADSFFAACQQSLNYLGRLPAERVLNYGPRQYTPAEIMAGLGRIRDILVRFPDPWQRAAALKREFVLLRSLGSDGAGALLMTGYYEPVLPGRRQPQPPYVHPLYGLPDDLVTFDLRELCRSFALNADCESLPNKRLVAQAAGNRLGRYPDRQAIDFAGAIRGKAKPLAYLDDLVEQFFLHIQGSGQVVFPDGGRIRVGYLGSNGHPYRSIGKLLIDQGLMTRDQMSMQNIKRLLQERPDLRQGVLAQNPSYVFFRELPAQGGPPGALGVPVTAGRSIAVDRRIFPDGAPGFISGTRPAPGKAAVEFSRFIVAQDTGGAIRGPGRLDLFFGSGREAGELAGRMKHQGRLYFFAPRR